MARAQAFGRSAGQMEPDGSRNWRITFAIHEKEGEITDLDFEDYH